MQFGALQVEETEPNCTNQLLFAVVKGEAERVRWLLKKNCRTFAIAGNWHTTALMYACNNGDIEIVQLLLDDLAQDDEPFKLSVYLNLETYGTALHYAIRSGKQQIVELLIDKGADCNKKNRKGCTPLVCALRKNYTSIAEFLIRKGADITLPNNRGNTPLMISIAHKNKAITTLLMNSGADWRAKNAHGQNSLVIAVSTNKISIVQILLDYLDPSSQTSLRPALFYAMNHDYTNIAKLLLIRIKGFDIKNEDGITPLMMSASKGNEELVTFLLENGASVNVTDNKGMTALDYAYFDGNLKGKENIIKLLLDQSAQGIVSCLDSNLF